MRAEANAIIVKLMQSSELDNCIKKVDPHLQDDLKAELALALLETEPEKIVLLFNRDSLRFYAVRIIINMTSPTGPFYRKHRCGFAETDLTTLHREDDYHSILHRKSVEEQALSEIDNLEWYEQEMVKLYLEKGNYREMEKATMIPFCSCFKTVKTAVNKIKQRL